MGVNNYIKKPFIADELDAHIQAMLKMKAGNRNRPENGCCQFGHYTLDAEHACLRDERTEKA